MIRWELGLSQSTYVRASAARATSQAKLLLTTDPEGLMQQDAQYPRGSQLDGQTSINDYLKPIPAIIPVELREPTDLELASFLAAQTP